MNVQQKTKGFTIIEVVLVLAIAGLIFLMVFLALPALQRNQRDTQRRGDLGRLAAAIQSYQSNNNGRVPFTWTTGQVSAYNPASFVADYLTNGNSSFDDPATPGTQYAFATAVAAGAVPTVSATGQISIVQTGAASTDCATATVAAGGPKIVYKMFLENGGSTCQFK